jgi:uncharacterized protein (UPF0276 family)
MSFHHIALHQRIQAQVEALNVLVHGTALVRGVPKERGAPPRHLHIDRHSKALCRSVNVLFKPAAAKQFTKQTMCLEADVARGFITRFTDRARKHTETLHGEVKIEWRT